MSKRLLLLWLEWWNGTTSSWQQEFMVTFHAVVFIVRCDQTDKSILSFAIAYPGICESKATVRELNTHTSISINHVMGDSSVTYNMLLSEKWPHKVNIFTTRNYEMLMYFTNQNPCKLFNHVLSGCSLKLINMFKKHLFYCSREIQ